MDEFKTRLIVEQEDLENRFKKLNAFINSEKFESIPKEQQTLLTIQAGAMNTYNLVLKARLDLL